MQKILQYLWCTVLISSNLFALSVEPEQTVPERIKQLKAESKEQLKEHFTALIDTLSKIKPILEAERKALDAAATAHPTETDRQYIRQRKDELKIQLSTIRKQIEAAKNELSDRTLYFRKRHLFPSKPSTNLDR